MQLILPICDMVVTEDRVATRVLMTGTHFGGFFRMAPTGKRVVVQPMQIERIANGRIVEHWRQTDGLGLMRELGLLQEAK